MDGWCALCMAQDVGEDGSKHSIPDSTAKKSTPKTSFLLSALLFYTSLVPLLSLFSIRTMSGKEDKEENKPGVEHRDPQYFGYYAMLQHQVMQHSIDPRVRQAVTDPSDGCSKTCCKIPCARRLIVLPF